jgi:hypothetical protein
MHGLRPLIPMPMLRINFVVLYSKLISRPMSHNYSRNNYGEVKSNIYHMVHSELKC